MTDRPTQILVTEDEEILRDILIDTHGRGIAMSRLLSFDRMEYRGRGNEVVCTVKRA